ncbi:Ff.00g088880.m01.CDS01 [Fusarium sp. VM40]|nr:Ff.00g088880.m01.CDS01 [Fusarium sp. VM40]
MADSSPDDLSAQAEFKAGQKRAGAERSNAKQRASLACVPCRSKHVKCDGLLPQCTRCKEEGKTCRYVNSRRGIRDTKKRSMMNDGTMTDQDDMTESTPSPSLAGSDISVPQPRAHTAPGPKQHIDLYYDHFHVAHPWLPPREALDHYWNTDQDGLQFLMVTVHYIGSLYSEPRGNADLQRRADHMSRQSLPLTVWSVQALLSLSIAAFGGHGDYASLFSKALQLALHLGLQHKGAADRYTDPVLGESCRRTYWGLYVYESLLNTPSSSFHSLVCPLDTISGTELPCEEWEYQARKIPAPVSLHQYDRSDTHQVYSSWAYFIDIIRIRDRYMIPLLHGCGKVDPNLLVNANQDINAWRFSIRDWKLQRVDEDGMLDTILYHALVVSHGLWIQIQLHLHRAPPQGGYQESGCSGQSSIYIPASLAQSSYNVADETDTSLPPTIQAPLRLVSLFNPRLEPGRLSPACVPLLEAAVISLIDSSCPRNGGYQDYTAKAYFLVGVLRKSGEFWSRSKETSERMHQRVEVTQARITRPVMTDIEAIASTSSYEDEYLGILSSMMGPIGGWSDHTFQSIRDTPTTVGFPSCPGMLSQSFGVDAMGAGAVAGTRRSYSHLRSRADGTDDGSRTSSPQIKVERQWL